MYHTAAYMTPTYPPTQLASPRIASQVLLFAVAQGYFNDAAAKGSVPLSVLEGGTHPFKTGCLPLSCSDNPGVKRRVLQGLVGCT
jgi:hypothetical protein